MLAGGALIHWTCAHGRESQGHSYMATHPIGIQPGLCSQWQFIYSHAAAARHSMAIHLWVCV
eukprot:9087925-Lingulodinium_polyedra.AAC.1